MGKDSSKINVGDIVSDHFKTLVNHNSKKAGFDDWLSFFIIPLAITILIYFISPIFSRDVSDTLITILSIFIGLLINVVVLLFDIIKRDKESKIKDELLKQTLTNISYTILVSILGIIMILATYIDNCFIRKFFSCLTYFVVAHILVTLLMVLKRIYTLFDNEINV